MDRNISLHVGVCLGDCARCVVVGVAVYARCHPPRLEVDLLDLDVVELIEMMVAASACRVIRAETLRYGHGDVEQPRSQEGLVSTHVDRVSLSVEAVWFVSKGASWSLSRLGRGVPRLLLVEGADILPVVPEPGEASSFYSILLTSVVGWLRGNLLSHNLLILQDA